MEMGSRRVGRLGPILGRLLGLLIWGNVRRMARCGNAREGASAFGIGVM